LFEDAPAVVFVAAAATTLDGEKNDFACSILY
jgi:hypothetical protein